MKPGIVDIIKTLDKRGIVNSIVSKNNHDEAMAHLESLGIHEYFVFPKISWDPKGEAIKELIRDFNVNEDTFAFIDDSPFEREQVKAVAPKVRVFEDHEYTSLLERAEFSPEVSSESSKRRYFYLTQGERRKEESNFSGEYADFIRSCNIKLNISPATDANIDRIHELIQRTNQMNFSSTRYSREEISEIVNSEDYDHYCLECSDKFGEYGIIGFCLVDKTKQQIIDLMFSCRVQSKRVEHALLFFLMNKYREEGWESLSARYIETDRNKAVCKVFDDLGYEKSHQGDNQYLFTLSLSTSIKEDNLIDVIWNETAQV